MWNDSTDGSGFRSVGALTDCSIILYVMTEKWPAGRKYRDLFESIKKSVLDAIAEGKHNPRTAVTSMKNDMQNTLHGIQVNTTTESIREDLEQMISDMTGEPICFWNDVDMNTGLEDDKIFEATMDSSRIVTPNGTGWEPSDSSLWFGAGFVDPEINNVDLEL